MKDIVISRQRILSEARIFIGCVVAALVVNAYSIIRFKTGWIELITTLHITLAVALVFFVLLALLRVLVFCCRLPFRRKAAG